MQEEQDARDIPRPILKSEGYPMPRYDAQNRLRDDENEVGDSLETDDEEEIVDQFEEEEEEEWQSEGDENQHDESSIDEEYEE